MEKQNEIKFKYDEHTLIGDMLSDERYKDMKAEGWEDEGIFNEAYDLFMDDEGNEFKNAGIDKGVIYEFETLQDMIYDCVDSSEMPPLITDFRRYVEIDFNADRLNSQKYNSNLTYDISRGTFYESKVFGKVEKKLTLTKKEYKRLGDIIDMLDDENPLEYGVNALDYHFVKEIINVETRYLNIENVEKRLWDIIRNYK